MTGLSIDGDLRAEHRALLAVVRRVIKTSAANVEDACQYAWLMYLRRPDIQASPTARGWLQTVAIRHALRLARGELRNVPEGPEPVGRDLHTTIEAREALRMLADVPERDRDTFALQLAGLSYVEIAECTGQTRRMVERRLMRTRHAVRAKARVDTG